MDLSRDRAPAARIGFEVKGASGIRTVVKQLRRKADLFAASNGLAEYADRYVVAEIDGRDSSVTFLNGLKLYAGQFSGGEERTALQRRVQIRETIRTHLRRERELYSREVKVLSLFFIDEVSKYRLYDGDSGSGRSGEYAKMFEEEYVAVAEAFRRDRRPGVPGLSGRHRCPRDLPGLLLRRPAEGPPGPLCGGKDRPQEPNLLRRGRL